MSFKRCFIFVFILMSTVQTAFASPEQYNRLYESIRSNYADAVRYLIGQEIDLNVVDKDGSSPLRLAVHNKASPEIVSLLIDGGANVNERDASGRSILMEALAVNAFPDVIQILVNKGAFLDERNSLGQTPLMLAMTHNLPLRTVIIFIYGKANVNIPDINGVTPLMQAIDKGASPSFVKLLLQAGSNLRLKDKNGRTAISIEQSKAQPNPEIMELFKTYWALMLEKEKQTLSATQTASVSDQTGAPSQAFPVPQVQTAFAEKPFNLLYLLIAVIFIALSGLFFFVHKKQSTTVKRKSVNKKVEEPKHPLQEFFMEDADETENVQDVRETAEKAPQEDYEEIDLSSSEEASEPEDDFEPIDLGEDETLFDAVGKENPNIDAVRSFLSQGVSVDDVDADGRTPLMHACEKNETTEVISLLLENGANVNATAKMGRTALMYAARHNEHVDVLRRLIEAGADYNAKDDLDVSVLMFARNFNMNEEVVSFLIDQGAVDNPDEISEMQEAPAYTRQVMPGTEVDVQDEHETTDYQEPEPETVQKPSVPKNDEMESSVGTRLVSRHGKRTDKEADSFIFDEDDFRRELKSEISKTEKARQILNRLGINAMSHNNALITPLMSVLAQGDAQKEIVSSLLEAGTDINARDENGMTPLMFAVMYHASVDVVQLLIKAGADINARDELSQTVLMKAVSASDKDVIKMLLGNGVDVSMKTKNGETALIFAARNATDAAVIRLLLSFGSDIHHKTDDGWTALMISAKEGKSPAVLLALLEEGADAKQQSPEGKKPLDYAKENENIQNTDAYWRLNDMSF